MPHLNLIIIRNTSSQNCLLSEPKEPICLKLKVLVSNQRIYLEPKKCQKNFQFIMWNGCEPYLVTKTFKVKLKSCYFLSYLLSTQTNPFDSIQNCWPDCSLIIGQIQTCYWHFMRLVALFILSIYWCVNNYLRFWLSKYVSETTWTEREKCCKKRRSSTMLNLVYVIFEIVWTRKEQWIVQTRKECQCRNSLRHSASKASCFFLDVLPGSTRFPQYSSFQII